MSPKRLKKLELLLAGGEGRRATIAHAHRPYFDLVREMTDAYNHRLRFARHAGQPWSNRRLARSHYDADGDRMAVSRSTTRRSDPREHRRAHQHCPYNTSHEIEQQVFALRRKLPTSGAAWLKREFSRPTDGDPMHLA